MPMPSSNLKWYHLGNCTRRHTVVSALQSTKTTLPYDGIFVNNAPWSRPVDEIIYHGKSKIRTSRHNKLSIELGRPVPFIVHLAYWIVVIHFATVKSNCEHLWFRSDLLIVANLWVSGPSNTVDLSRSFLPVHPRQVFGQLRSADQRIYDTLSFIFLTCAIRICRNCEIDITALTFRCRFNPYIRWDP